MSKILVTGGNGFIGTNFIKQAIDIHGYDVVNVDKMTYASRPDIDLMYRDNPKYKKITKDICKLYHIPDDVEAIVNIAAESHVDNSIHGPEVFLNSNPTKLSL